MDVVPLDDILVKTYEDFDTPADRFIGDAVLTEAFVTAVRRRAGDSSPDPLTIMRRLVTLRKQGRLPRLRRSYYGRGPSAN